MTRNGNQYAPQRSRCKPYVYRTEFASITAIKYRHRPVATSARSVSRKKL